MKNFHIYSFQAKRNKEKFYTATFAVYIHTYIERHVSKIRLVALCSCRSIPVRYTITEQWQKLQNLSTVSSLQDTFRYIQRNRSMCYRTEIAGGSDGLHEMCL